jgi:hypothetical protein
MKIERGTERAEGGILTANRNDIHTRGMFLGPLQTDKGTARTQSPPLILRFIGVR